MPHSLGEELRDFEHDSAYERAPDRPCDESLEEPLHYGRIGRQRPSAQGHAAAVAAWFEAHQDQLFECERHNGRARLTIQACAQRYRRAVKGWVNQLQFHENRKHPLRLSFAVCAACPVGAYNFRATRPR